jgi:fucose permease
MIKAIKILLYSEIVFLLVVISIVVYVTPGNYSTLPYFIQGFYAGVTGSSHGLSDYSNGFILGSTLIFPMIGIILPLITIYKKSKVLRIISMVLLGLFVISYSVGGYFAIFSIVIFILFFTKPVKKYFAYSIEEKVISK